MLGLLKSNEGCGMSVEVRMDQSEWKEIQRKHQAEKLESFKIGFISGLGCAVMFALFVAII